MRALAKQAAAEERVQALERELADAEYADQRTLGDELVEGKNPPARKTGQARAFLQQARPRRSPTRASVSARSSTACLPPAAGVEGLVRDVPVTDVLAALREQMFDLEADVLLGAKA